MVSLVDEEKWAPLVGHFLIAFGSIERVTHDCIRRWLGEILYKHIMNLPLSPLIELAIDLVSLQPYSDTDKAQFIRDLRNAKILVKQRNLLAHSPLQLVLYDDDPNMPLRETIASIKPNGAVVEFEELSEVVDRVKAIVKSLNHDIAAFRVSTLDLTSIPSNWKGFGSLKG